jgi:hypothetical protein
MKVICLNKQQYINFLQEQSEEIKRHKWIESEKNHCDMGNLVCIQWVDQYAKEFKKNWVSKNFGIIEDEVFFEISK